MKVSINLANEYSNVDLKNISTDLMIEKIGSQLGAVEEVIYWAPKYQGVVVVKIIECEKHPNADKLHVCKIDDGGVTKNVDRDSNGLVQVVCGAPNVKKDIHVAWIPPRSIVPSTRGTDDEFTLDARELRGVISNGMLASAHELAINDDHSGILEISKENSGKDPKPGDNFINYYGLDDVVIDCENKMFTHRPDCFGVLGVARELAGINGMNFTSPEWYKDLISIKTDGKLPLDSKNEIKKLVPRFMAQVIEGVDIKPSKLKMQVDLVRNGYRALNNIVDYTNYFMHLTSQPTHAFDYDKIKALCAGGPTIFPRMAKDGEELKLLNGKTIKLTKDDIVISTDKKAVALAGVMGGAETEVDEKTKNVILECATFDMYTIRRTSMRHGIFTDAVSRFNKGQSPLQNDKVLAKLVSEINQECGSTAGKIIDIKDDSVKESPTVKCSIEFINNRLGRKFEADEVADLLLRTEFSVKVISDELIIQPPYWRRDIKHREDVVEEVGRLFGFGQLPTELPIRKTVVVPKNYDFSFKRQMANTLKSFGANEILSYSFVHGDLLGCAGQNVDNAYQIRNALSPELQYYRISLTPSLLSHVHQNIKAGFQEFALFELGLIHNKKYGLNNEKVPVEKATVAFVYAANDKVSKEKKEAPYFTAKSYLDSLLYSTGINYRYDLVDASSDFYSPFEKSRSALLVSSSSNEVIGILGEFKSSLHSKLKLPRKTAGFELYIDAISKEENQFSYRIISKYPSSEQDLTLQVNYDVDFSTIHESIIKAIESVSDNYDVVVTPLSIYSTNKHVKNYTFRLNVSHSEKTMKTEEVNKLIEQITENIRQNFDVTRVGALTN